MSPMGPMDRTGRTGRTLAISVVLLGGAGSARAENPFPESTVVSPGIKLGWTFGERGGLTYGIEVTVLRSTGEDARVLLAHGPAFNLSWTRRGTSYVRLGWEAVTWGAGIEGGPTIVFRDGRVQPGLTISPWIGALVVPYYAFTIVGDGPIKEAGLYGKLPLCFGCEGGDGFGDDDDDDD